MTRRLTIAFVLALACRPSDGADAGDDEHEGHEGEAHEHRDEPEHGAIPRQVELTPDVAAAMGIRTEPVQRERLAPTQRLVGEIEADVDRMADIPARVAGTLASIAVREGDRVVAGQTIAVVRAPGLGALRSAKTSLAARLSAADAKVQRLTGLVDQRLAARAELEAAIADAESLRAELRGAGQQLRALEVGRGKTRDPLGFAVVAPKGGVVVKRHVVVGEPVNESSVLATVVDLDEAWFAARVFEQDLARIHIGAAAEVRLAADEERPYEGTIETIAHAVDPGARTLTARIRVRDGEGRLRLGLFGSAEVVVAPADSPLGDAPVLVVSRTAVIELDRAPIVFVRQPDGHFEVHDVVLGRTAPGRIEILHGLREGEEVVVDGAFNLKSVLLRETLHGDHH
jgi:cobalt-zinc-cadmium efflux system membrane fusion protein